MQGTQYFVTTAVKTSDDSNLAHATSNSTEMFYDSAIEQTSQQLKQLNLLNDLSVSKIGMSFIKSVSEFFPKETTTC